MNDTVSGSAEFDKVAAQYDAELNRGLQLTGEPKEYFAETRTVLTRCLLGSEAAKVHRILDFGCGTGTAAPFLLESFPNTAITGVDPSEESLVWARTHHGGPNVSFMLPDQVACEAGSFDLAYCNGVFHHIPPQNREKAVKLVWDALRPGGFFALWENNPWNPATRFVMSRVPFDRDAILLWPAETRRRLRAAGFQIVVTRFAFVFPAILKGLRWTESFVSALPLGGQYVVLARKPL